MEKLLSQLKKTKEYKYTDSKGRNRTEREHKPRYGFVRYADDFIVTAENREDLEAVKPILELWLNQPYYVTLGREFSETTGFSGFRKAQA